MTSAQTPGDRLRELRQALKLSQKQVAETSLVLTREYVVRIETGARTATTDHVRGALAKAYGLTRDQLANYLDGNVSLAQLLAARQSQPEPPGTPTLRHHPRWAELVEEAMRLRSLSRVDLDRIADTPFVWGPIETVDAAMVADLARDVADWCSRRSSRSRRG